MQEARQDFPMLSVNESVSVLENSVNLVAPLSNEIIT